MTVDMIINGRATTLEARSDEMLLPVLRRHGLLSVRETCGIGVCGACTVLLDGEPVSGCLMLTAAAADLPRLTYDLIERDGAEVHGLGETALPPIPPAIGNALASLGVHVTELPITAERVLEALER